MVIVPAIGAATGIRLLNFTDISSMARLPLWTVATHKFAEKPWGIGSGRFAEVVRESGVHGLTFDDAVMVKLGAIESHNFFLNILLYYGVQGAILFTVVSVLFWRLALRLSNGVTPQARIIGISGIVGITGIYLNGIVHNTGLLNGDSGLAFLLAAVLAMCASLYPAERVTVAQK